MSTLELKNILIQKISLINDHSFLEALRTILDAKTESTIYHTSSQEKANISEAIVQLENGESLDNDIVESEIDKWLGEK